MHSKILIILSINLHLKLGFFAILKNKIIDYLRQKGRFVLESELEDEDTNNSFFDEKGHWKPEYYPSELQGEEETVYSDEFWLIFETCLTCLPAKQAKVFYDARIFRSFI